MASAAACYAPLCVASQSNRICTRRMPSAERRLRRLPRLRLRLASRRRPRFVRGHCLSVLFSIADHRSVFANSLCAVHKRGLLCNGGLSGVALRSPNCLCKARPESQVLLTIGASDKACAESQKGPDRRIARVDEERQSRGRRR